MLFTKLAILVQIQHIFMPVGTRGSSYWLAVLLMLIGPGYYIAAAIVEIAQCIPREKISNPFVPGFCINNDVNVIFAGAFNLGYDILLFALPIYCILHLQLALRRKLGVCAIFAIGLLLVPVHSTFPISLPQPSIHPIPSLSPSLTPFHFV